MEESPFSCDSDRERDRITEHRSCQRRKGGERCYPMGSAERPFDATCVQER
jgi:hypothetical protein